jgi:hypothetical protein
MTISRTWNPDRIKQIAQEVQAISRDSRDYIVPREQLSAINLPGEGLALQINLPGGEPSLYHPSAHATRQLAQTLQMSGHYVKRLQASGYSDLLAHNLQELLRREPDRSHMVRTVGERARAVLSDSFRTVDNWDVLKASLQAVQQAGGEVWNLRHDNDGGTFRFQAWNPAIREQLKMERAHDIFRPGKDDGEPFLYPVISVGNSELGTGSTFGSIGFIDGICSNTCIWSREVAKVHLGRKKDAGEYLASDETRALESQMVVSQIRDLIRTAFNPEAFQAFVRKVEASMGREVPQEVKATQLVTATCKLHKLPDEHAEALLESFLQRGDRSCYGLASAVNSLARPESGIKVSDSLAVELEETAGAIMQMGNKVWGQLLATASAD